MVTRLHKLPPQLAPSVIASLYNGENSSDCCNLCQYACCVLYKLITNDNLERSMRVKYEVSKAKTMLIQVYMVYIKTGRGKIPCFA